MSTKNCNVTPGKVFVPDTDGKVQITPDGLNLLGKPTVTVDLDDGVESADIVDGSVTAAKLASNAVTTAKILDANVTTAKVADSAITTAKVADGNITSDKVAAAALTQKHAAASADSAVVGAIPCLIRVPVPAGVTGDVDVVLTYKTRVTDAWLVKTNAAGGGAGTVQVFNGATAITDAMSINVADKAVVRATTIDDASHEVAAAGTLRITRTRSASTDETCIVYILGVSCA